MTTSWQSFAGDTSRFALRIALQADPHDTRAATPEESASWGSLAVWVRGTNLCAYTADDISSDGVHWYLLPIAEWFVENWDSLLHEEKPPNRDAGVDAAASLHATRFPPAALDERAASEWERDWGNWWRRHCLLAARSGGLLPDVTIRRFRDEIEFSWRESNLAGAPTNLQFASTSGTARLEPLEVAEPLREVLSELALELANRLPRSTRVRQLARSVGDLDSRERYERRMAWLSGLGTTTSTAVRRWRAALSSIDTSRPNRRLAADVFGRNEGGLVISETPVLGLLFGSANPRLPAEDVNKIMMFVLERGMEQSTSPQLHSLVHHRGVPLDFTDAVADGRDLAEDALAALDLPPESRIDIDAVLKSLGVHVDDLRLTDKGTRAITIASPSLSPTIAVNSGYHWHQREPVRRYTLAHELCHILADQSRARRVAVTSGPWAPRSIERRANAFAAAFLMPVESVKWAVAEVDAPTGSVESVVGAAKLLGTSASSTLERLGNLGLLDPPTIDGLRETLHWSRLEDRAN